MAEYVNGITTADDWYVVTYHAGRSRKEALRHLRKCGIRDIPQAAAWAAFNLVQCGAAVFCPLIEERRLMRATERRASTARAPGRRWLVDQVPAFPGYLFVQACTVKTLNSICKVDAADVLRGADNAPAVVPSAAMETFLAGPIPLAAPQRGDEITVTIPGVGALPATFVEMESDDRCKILLYMLGVIRESSVPFDLVG